MNIALLLVHQYWTIVNPVTLILPLTRIVLLRPADICFGSQLNYIIAALISAAFFQNWIWLFLVEPLSVTIVYSPSPSDSRLYGRMKPTVLRMVSRIQHRQKHSKYWHLRLIFLCLGSKVWMLIHSFNQGRTQDNEPSLARESKKANVLTNTPANKIVIFS